MIDREHPSAFQLFFVMQGSVVPRILPKIIVIMLLSALVLLADLYAYKLPHMSMAALGVFAIALSLFLGFRNNAAYDRWWEGRKLWGSIIADMRNLGRQAGLFISDQPVRLKLLGEAVGFVHLHRIGLRGSGKFEDISSWMDAESFEKFQMARNPADAALNQMAKTLSDARSNDRITELGLFQISETINRIATSQAGCERIATTPLPFVYSLLVRRTTYLYCLLVPFALVESAGWFTPLLAGIIAYVFFGLQAVTRELEHPFQNVINGLPLDTMCRIIEISVSESLGLEPPASLLAQKNILT